jgi:hypothetical protein
VVRSGIKRGSKLLIGVYKRGKPVTRNGGPGRAGLAFGDFCVEPFPLDFWKLKRSFSLSRPSGRFACPQTIRRLAQRFRLGGHLPLSPYHRQACLMVIAFFVIASPTSTDSVTQDARRISLVPSIGQAHAGLLIVEVVQTSIRRGSRARSPEIPGRIVFFVSAVGRSPPS